MQLQQHPPIEPRCQLAPAAPHFSRVCDTRNPPSPTATLHTYVRTESRAPRRPFSQSCFPNLSTHPQINQMVRDAETYAEKDKTRKELIEVRGGGGCGCRGGSRVRVSLTLGGGLWGGLLHGGGTSRQQGWGQRNNTGRVGWQRAGPQPEFTVNPARAFSRTSLHIHTHIPYIIPPPSPSHPPPAGQERGRHRHLHHREVAGRVQVQAAAGGGGRDPEGHYRVPRRVAGEGACGALTALPRTIGLSAWPSNQ